MERLQTTFELPKPTEGKFALPSWAERTTRGVAWHCVKDGAILETAQLHAKLYYLLGRNPQVSSSSQNGEGVLMQHPSLSRRHAVVVHAGTRSFLVDLDSVHGTFINDRRLLPYRPVELVDRNVLRFGHSTRRYLVRVFPLPTDIQNFSLLDDEATVRALTHMNSVVLLNRSHSAGASDHMGAEMDDGADGGARKGRAASLPFFSCEVDPVTGGVRHSVREFEVGTAPSGSSSESGSVSHQAPIHRRRVSFSSMDPEIIASGGGNGAASTPQFPTRSGSQLEYSPGPSGSLLRASPPAPRPILKVQSQPSSELSNSFGSMSSSLSSSLNVHHSHHRLGSNGSVSPVRSPQQSVVQHVASPPYASGGSPNWYAKGLTVVREESSESSASGRGSKRDTETMDDGDDHHLVATARGRERASSKRRCLSSEEMDFHA